MVQIEDISTETDNAYRIADAINGGSYSNVLYYEFHEPVNPENIWNCFEGLESFQERSKNFYGIFFSSYLVDDIPANIHVVIRFSSTWFIAKNCGANYYGGYGPTGILKMREACAKQNVICMAPIEKFDEWLSDRFKPSSIDLLSDKKRIEQVEFDKLIKSFRYLATDMQRRPSAFAGFNEENIRDKMLSAINTVFEGRANGEAKSRRGKTDILVRTIDGLNEHIFELKVWKSINCLESAIEQLKGYLAWHNDLAGIIMFCYNSDFTKLLEKVEDYLKNGFLFHKRKRVIENEFRFKIAYPTDSYKSIEIYLILINLKT